MQSLDYVSGPRARQLLSLVSVGKSFGVKKIELNRKRFLEETNQQVGSRVECSNYSTNIAKLQGMDRAKSILESASNGLRASRTSRSELRISR